MIGLSIVAAPSTALADRNSAHTLVSACSVANARRKLSFQSFVFAIRNRGDHNTWLYPWILIDGMAACTLCPLVFRGIRSRPRPFFMALWVRG